MLATFLALASLSLANGQVPDEDWGYVDVRSGAHSFWWLYGAISTTREGHPLILWLQGGPGGSSTGYGNFLEMGPLDTHLNPRAATWLNAPANLLFVDNPVGAGYSYVDDLALIPRTNAAIAADLVTLMAAFFGKFPSLQASPFYVFSESYGGKMTATFSLALLEAIDAGTVKANFKGYVMGDSWISGTDHVDAWCPFLRSVDLLDDAQLQTCLVPVAECNAATAAGDWQGSINAWGKAENVISELTDGVDFYNILVHGSAGDLLSRSPNPRLRLSEQDLALLPPGVDPAMMQVLFTNHLSVYLGDDLDALMNGPIREKLKVIPSNVTWGGQSGAVFSTLSLDFMRPVVADVDAALAGGRLNVVVEEGQLDLICSGMGADLWMRNMSWSGMPSFYASQRQPRYPDAQAKQLGATSGFIKTFGKLTRYDGEWRCALGAQLTSAPHFMCPYLTLTHTHCPLLNATCTVLSAGHLVPMDNPGGALAMARELTGLPY